MNVDDGEDKEIDEDGGIVSFILGDKGSGVGRSADVTKQVLLSISRGIKIAKLYFFFFKCRLIVH